MSKYKPNSAEQIDTCAARLKALNAYVKSSSAKTISVNGTTYKASDVIAMYQACLDARATLDTQRAQVKATQKVRAAAETQRRAADRALKPWVINQFGADSQEATDFGFPPAKKATRSVENKTNAVALSKATRAARHTMGKVQKEKIKGTIVVPAAPAEPAVTVQAATPVASTPSEPTVATRVNGVAAAANGASLAR